MLASFLRSQLPSDKERTVKAVFRILLPLCLAATAQAQIVDNGLILDLDADKGVEVEDGSRVVRCV